MDDRGRLRQFPIADIGLRVSALGGTEAGANPMMSERDREILAAFSRRVRERFPAARIWAFGSRARGDATEESDFDFCVVLDRFTPEEKAVIRHLSWEVAFENEQVFNTVLFSIEEFEQGPMSESTLRQNILREGIAA